MERMTDSEIIQRLKLLSIKYPNISEIRLEYHGSGDSFDSYDISTVYKDSDTKHTTIYESDVEDMFWELVERANSDFNNDGARGTVVFNLETYKAPITDYYYFTESNLNTEIEIDGSIE